MTPTLWGVKQVAEYFGLGVASVRKAASEGRLPMRWDRRRRGWVVEPETLERWMVATTRAQMQLRAKWATVDWPDMQLPYRTRRSRFHWLKKA